ncbi:MAG: GIY-YIG nuclease family protein [Terracidiphilus sp.]
MMKRTKGSKPVAVAEDDLEEKDLAEVDDDDPEESPGPAQNKIVSKFIRMLPRAIFDMPEIKGEKGSIASYIDELKQPGVYILYRDDVPFYVGKTEGKLFDRIWTHANGVSSTRSYFWNYFSAFIVKDRRNIAEVEAILISAMPSVITNAARPKLQKVRKGISTIKLMREMRKTYHY